jgi:DNA-binding LacI/PurR family transcriptional regulator
VEPDHRLAGELALEYLIDKGCRNLCAVTHTPSWETRRYDGERTDAFQCLARLRSIPCQILGEDLPYVDSQAEIFEQTRRIVDDFLALSPRPDGMFIANEMTSYIHEHLSRKGIVPMRDVLIVGGDRENTPRHLAPAPASIDIRASEIGRLAVHVLANRLCLPDVPRIRQLVETMLIIP